MEIVYKKTLDLKPYEDNPRIITDEAIEKVANSIKEFGFKNPILIDKDNVIIAGHTRYKACLKLDIDKVPCIYADDLTEEQIKAYRLVDNRTSELSMWDFSMLDIELEDISIDMEAFGFEKCEEVALNVNDEDFLQDTEITKNKEAKKIICPKCGEIIEI